MGVSHKSAPLDLLEHCNVAPADLAQRLADLTNTEQINEAVIISTCNRTEIYAAADDDSASTNANTTAITAQLHEHFLRSVQKASAAKTAASADTAGDGTAGDAAANTDQLRQHLYTYDGNAAAAHLFALASGIESAVIGESEILGQVKTAWETARANNASSTTLNHLFRHALEAAKRARTQTKISHHTASVPHAAVAMATSQLGSLTDRKVLVVGAGEMAQAVVVALSAAGPAEVLIANRTTSHATQLAQRVNGRTISLTEIEDTLTQVDVLLTATGASQIIVEAAHIDTVAKRRAGAPLLIVDIAVPRDVNSSVALIDGVTLLDMDDLAEFAAAGRSERESEIAAVREIIAEEIARYAQAWAERASAPVITAMRASIEASADAELQRIFARHPNWDSAHRAAVEAMTKSLVAKFLHKPTVAIKDAAGTESGEQLMSSARQLFDI